MRVVDDPSFTLTLRANRPQLDFLYLPRKYRAFVGGFGSGKTWVGCMAMCLHGVRFPRLNQGYFAPTYPMIRDIFYPTIAEVAETFGMRCDIKQGNKEVHFYYGNRYMFTTICRSMDNPNTIIGFKIANALIDEFDLLSPPNAELAWRKIIARMRYVTPKGTDWPLRNGVDVTTTPEGFRATHKLFVQALQENPELKGRYGIVQASTRLNAANLPEDYIPSLYETYTAELVDAYIEGQFCNLTSGTVFRNYNRVRCESGETILPQEVLSIGMDFNVQHMAATIYVQRPNGWHAVAEAHDVFDTPAMIELLDERYRLHGHRCIVYPDASAKGRETIDASRSDISMLRAAGYEIRANPTNPSVKDRINSTNKQFERGALFVNSRACPTVARCLEGQSYDVNGEPDKTSGFDHQNEASSYPIAYEFPILHDDGHRMVLHGI